MLRSTKTREPVANRLLAALPGKEYQRLRPHLEEVTLAFGEVLYESGEIIRRVYFPNHGIVSLLSMVEERSTLEVGVVGAEGMVGISVFLGAHASLNQALVQGAGAAMSMKADAMRKHVGHEGPFVNYRTLEFDKALSARHICQIVNRWADFAGLNQNPNKGDPDRLGSRKKPKPRLKLSPHDLRRTAVTRALSLGFTYRQVQSMTGHKDIRMVVKYDHERGNIEDNAINFLNYEEKKEK